MIRRKALLPIIVVVVTGLGAVTLLATSERLAPTQPEPVPPSVRVLDVEPKPVQMVVHAQGTVLPRIETELVPEISGNVVWISPNLVTGGYFDVDEPLLRVDDRDYRNAVERAGASMSRAEAELEFAEFELGRLETLETSDLVSRSALESAMREARVNEAGLRDARVALEQAERDLARTEIRAPFRGLVRSEQIDVGQFVNRGTSIASLYAVDYVEIRLPIADQQLAYLDLPPTPRGELEADSAPSVRLYADFAGRQREWQGRLVRTEAEIDARSRMVQAVARLTAADYTNADLLPPVGLFVQAEIQGRSADNVVVLPRGAIRNENQVLIVDAENRLRFRTVTLLRVYGDEAFISDGLSAGERVCISPLQAVVDGMRIVPIEGAE
ncbi:MAG: efflux RND transporter periplasmic adaptor subunit [Gammaproteobacteria bacterium]|nr:efflux RND transporter periplasmic adaptor subunit [Gammaproteobacteria bacterium]MDH3505952.1 efflux RND transporter periplasmic adaptor subunit [Gammaproteobacteria bacterium]